MPSVHRTRTRKPTYEPVLRLPPLAHDDFMALRDSIAVHGVLVPILVDGQARRRKIIDGNYRKIIADELGYDCPEVVQDGLSEEEKRTLARGLNLARRQLTQDHQKRRLISDQLRDTPGRSNRWIGKQLGVSHPTVASVRAELESSGKLFHCERLLGADGREQPSYRPGKRVFQNPPELRRPCDFYPTPPHATRALIDREKFNGLILEPACGDGAIVRVLREHGYDVGATDLAMGDDFFQRTGKVANIVTNPPYHCILEFVQRAKEIATRKIALLLPVEFCGMADPALCRLHAGCIGSSRPGPPGRHREGRGWRDDHLRHGQGNRGGSEKKGKRRAKSIPADQLRPGRWREEEVRRQLLR